MEELANGTERQGRSLALEAWGANADALEFAALDGAREFFGLGARLEVVRDYIATRYDHESPERRFHARITVTEAL